jgi:methionyl-tRNA formyltransferase
MKLVFCGTPEFAVASLQAVVDAGHEIALVLTQPDRPAGRRMEMQVPAVKQRALALGLPVEQPEKIKHNLELRARLEAIAPDAIMVVAYGRIIPDWMLVLPRLGNLNVHGSLLPKYRGAAPIQWAVANGETETGVTTMRLDAGLDTGDVLLMQRISVGQDTTSAELYPQLAAVGAELLVKTLAGLADGSVVPVAQDHAQATLAPILTREDGRLRLTEFAARQTYDRWRGFDPWPGCWSTFRGKRFLVYKLAVVSDVVDLTPWELRLIDDRLCVGAFGRGGLVLEEVQMEGKPKMAGAAFARDFQLKMGERLE